jgi:hypothetical protein
MKEIRLLKDLDLLHIGASSRAFPAIADGPGYVVHGTARPDKQSEARWLQLGVTLRTDVLVQLRMTAQQEHRVMQGARRDIARAIYGDIVDELRAVMRELSELQAATFPAMRRLEHMIQVLTMTDGGQEG